MAEPKTTRPFQQRFLDGYDRSQLRQEVQKVKPSRFSGLKRKYATLALGASLAFGGIGVPMKMVHDAQSKTTETGGQRADATANPAADGSGSTAIAGDLATARNIATQVAGGVQAVANGVTGVAHSPLATVAEAPQQIAKAVAGAPQAVAKTADAVKENFFKTQVPFGSIIYDEAKKNDLAPELVAAVVHTESKFVPTARSQAGAIGLMQLVPKTGRWMGARDLTNPAQNIAAGAKYLRYLSNRFGGDEQKTIAAFNAGEGNVRRFGGVPPFRETVNYISRVNSFKSDLTDQVSNHTLIAEAR
jgi:soluble lytic murein transglycosylase-like protein